ncbi:MAG: helix-turn-helix domain-containing protein [Chloroflexota bacterium]|nr:helix-turn-helix domain-containing protein [Chloroflexota bacterium]
MPGIKYPRLGELIDYLIKHWAVQEHWTMAHTMDEVAALTHFAKPTIHHWRKGTARPDDTTLATLARLGRQIGLDRRWGAQLLQAARHPEATLLEAIWGPVLLKEVPNNLPACAPRPLVGREAELAELQRLLHC